MEREWVCGDLIRLYSHHTSHHDIANNQKLHTHRHIHDGRTEEKSRMEAISSCCTRIYVVFRQTAIKYYWCDINNIKQEQIIPQETNEKRNKKEQLNFPIRNFSLQFVYSSTPSQTNTALNTIMQTHIHTQKTTIAQFKINTIKFTELRDHDPVSSSRSLQTNNNKMCLCHLHRY